MGFADHLKKGDINLEEARKSAKKGGFSELPEGTYKAQILSAEVKQSEASGKWMCQWRLGVTEGDQKGQTALKHSMLETEQNLSFFFKDIDGCGWPIPEDPDAIEEIVAEISKAMPIVKITVKKSGDFLNIYFNGLIEGGPNKVVAQKPKVNDMVKCKDGDVGKVLEVTSDGLKIDVDGKKYEIEYSDVETIIG